MAELKTLCSGGECPHFTEEQQREIPNQDLCAAIRQTIAGGGAGFLEAQPCPQIAALDIARSSAIEAVELRSKLGIIGVTAGGLD